MQLAVIMGTVFSVRCKLGLKKLWANLYGTRAGNMLYYRIREKSN